MKDFYDITNRYWRFWQRALLSTSLMTLPYLSPLGAQPLQILKTDHGTHSLNVIDLNNDGHSEIVIANRDQGSIDIFEQTQSSEESDGSEHQINHLHQHSGYEKINIPLTCDIYALAVMDINGDGLPDLIYHGNPSGLQIQRQRPDGGFDAPVEFSCELGRDTQWSLLCIPRQEGVEVLIQHDKHRSHFLLYGNDENGIQTRWVKTFQIPMIEKEHFTWMQYGKWKDGSNGIWVHQNDDTYPVSFYRQRSEGNYDPPIQWELPQTRMLIPGKFMDKDHLDFIQVRTQQGQLFSLQPDVEKGSKKRSGGNEKIHSRTLPFSHSQSEYYTGLTTDLDEDGCDELLVAHRDSAEVEVFTFSDGKMFQHESQPTFRDISYLGRPRGVTPKTLGRHQIMAFSATEKMAGISSFGDGKLSFPRLSFSKLRASKHQEVSFIDYKNRAIALRYNSSEDQLYIHLGEQDLRIDIEEPWPERGHAVHLTSLDHPDLILQIPYEGIKIMSWDEGENRYLDASSKWPFFNEESLQDLHLGAISFLPGSEGYMDLTMSQGRMIRRYSFFPEPNIVGQVNLPKVGSISSHHLICQFFPKAEWSLISLDRDRSEIDFFRLKDNTFVWEARHRCQIKNIESLFELKSQQGSSLICLGKGEAEWISMGGGAHGSPVGFPLGIKQKPWQFFRQAEAIHLENGKDIALIYDSKKFTYNFFKLRDDRLGLLASFPVLERKSFRESQTSIGHLRGVLGAPLNKGDKHAIVSLMDDRILIYRR